MLDDLLGRLVQTLIKEHVEVISLVVQEVLHEAAIEQVAVNVHFLLPVDHVLVFEGIRRVPDRSILRLGLLVPARVPVSRDFSFCQRRQRGYLLSFGSYIVFRQGLSSG